MITAHQALFGYDEGHGLLACSVGLERAELQLLEKLSDLNGYLEPGTRFESYDMGYPCGRFYALSRTWPDQENRRPGTVFTQVLLLEQSQASALEDPSALTHALRRVPIPARRQPAPTLALEPAQVGEPYLDPGEATRLLGLWFGDTHRPVLLPEHPMAAVRYLWRRLPRWGRAQLSWCTFSPRPRAMEGSLMDLQGVAPGAWAAFAHLQPRIEPRESPVLEVLRDPARAQGVWREAESVGFAQASPLVWLRFRERDARAAHSYPDALGALDLLAALPAVSAAQAPLRERAMSRVLRAAAEPGALRVLADLLVRDVERAYPGSRARVRELLQAQLEQLSVESAPQDVALLARCAVRGGYEAVLDAGLASAIERSDTAWAVAWELRPALAGELWERRSSEELARRLSHLPDPARVNLIQRLPQDALLWRELQDLPGAQARALEVLDSFAQGGGDWPADAKLYLPEPLLIERAQRWTAPPSGLAQALAAQLADSPSAVETLAGQPPAWLTERWLSVEPDSLARLLQASTPLRALAAQRLAHTDWPLLLDASPNPELIALSPPPEHLHRWLDRAAPEAVRALLRGELTLVEVLEVLNQAPEAEAVLGAVKRLARQSPERALDLLQAPEALPLRRARAVVLAVVVAWSQGGCGHPEQVVALLGELRSASESSWEAACGAVLASCLELPSPSLGPLAAFTFPVLHRRLCDGRDEGWLIRQIERYWSGYWDRAGKLRERYAQAWKRGDWPTQNLVEAAAGDKEVLEKLGKEVRWLWDGKLALQLRRGQVSDRELRILLG